MPFITLGTTAQLQIKVPTRGTVNWDETMRTDTFLKIATHDHSGTSGNGVQIGTASLASDSVTGLKILLANDQYLRGRNQADSADVNIIKVNTGDELEFGATVGVITLQDDGLSIFDNADNTKILAFDASGITTATTRTLSSPDASGTIVLNDNTVTLENKTLTSPTINGGAINSPTTMDVSDSVFSIQDNTDATKEIRFEASSITTGTIRTATMPDANGTLLLEANTATVTNKSIDSDNNTITNIVNADIKAAAAIAVNKLAALTASRAVTSDGSGFLSASATTSTELGYVSGVTSAIQTQINGKLPTTITTTGDIIYSSSGTTAARLGIGSAGQVLTVSGGIPAWGTNVASIIGVTQKTANYTVTTDDTHVEATANTFTFTLYAVSGNSGRRLVVSNTGTGVITIDPDGAETFNDGSTAKYLSQDQAVALTCNGTEWIVDSIVPLHGYVKDIRSNGTNGGGSTAGSFQTRTLNTASGDFTKFASLSSNQITLEPGTYHIEGFAPIFGADSSQSRLRNITDSTDDLTSSTDDDSATPVQIKSTFTGTISITSSKVFEVQSHVQTTQASNGYGAAYSGSGLSEVYTQLKITKVV